MRFADARRTEEDDVFAALDEAELVETFHLLTPERGLEGKIKFGQPFDDRETARAHRGLQAPVVAQLDLGVQELLDGLGGGERRTIDTVENRIERFEGAGHVQVGEHVAQAIATGERRGFHASPPVSRAYTASGRFSTVATGCAVGSGRGCRGAVSTRDVYGRAASGCSSRRSSRSNRSRGRSRV